MDSTASHLVQSPPQRTQRISSLEEVMVELNANEVGRCQLAQGNTPTSSSSTGSRNHQVQHDPTEEHEDNEHQDCEANGRGKKRRARSPSHEKKKRDKKRDESIVRRFTVLSDGACCKSKLDALELALLPAVRTAKEVERSKYNKKVGDIDNKKAADVTDSSSSSQKPATVYNHARLFELLAKHAFDSYGNCIAHQCCVARRVGVTFSTLTRTRQRAKSLASAATEKISKSRLVALKLEGFVVVPDEAGPISQLEYLSGLDGTDEVEVPAKHLPSHGLAGKESNRAMKPQQEAFKKWVIENRIPSGRTAVSEEHFDGPEYFLSERFKYMKQRTEKEIAQGRKKESDDSGVEVAFRRHCENDISPPLKAPTGSCLIRWMGLFFGAGSPDGHTTIHPQKASRPNRYDSSEEAQRFSELTAAIPPGISPDATAMPPAFTVDERAGCASV